MDKKTFAENLYILMLRDLSEEQATMKREILDYAGQNPEAKKMVNNVLARQKGLQEYLSHASVEEVMDAGGNASESPEDIAQEVALVNKVVAATVSDNVGSFVATGNIENMKGMKVKIGNESGNMGKGIKEKASPTPNSKPAETRPSPSLPPSSQKVPPSSRKGIRETSGVVTGNKGSIILTGNIDTLEGASFEMDNTEHHQQATASDQGIAANGQTVNIRRYDIKSVTGMMILALAIVVGGGIIMKILESRTEHASSTKTSEQPSQTKTVSTEQLDRQIASKVERDKELAIEFWKKGDRERALIQVQSLINYLQESIATQGQKAITPYLQDAYQLKMLILEDKEKKGKKGDH